MAGSSLFALIDDIATLLDDIAVLTKVAAKKTAGVLGDDLALNANQVSGVNADRELPVVWAVAKGSFINKCILVPLALLLSAFASFLILPLLMIGGAYLCYEGFEKIYHSLFHKSDDAAHEKALMAAVQDESIDLVALEKDKIKGAIRTDFILSAEIVVITLGTVAASSLLTQTLVISVVAILMTVGVYGLVAGIVKIDDLGLHLYKDKQVSTWGTIKRKMGMGFINAAPPLMRILSVLGTWAMFLVGGSIVIHSWHALHEARETLLVNVFSLPIHTFFHTVASSVADILVGILLGGLVFLVMHLAQPFLAKKP